jgi:hypothetical protein
MVLLSLDSSIVAVMLPSLRNDTGLTPQQPSWLVSIHLLPWPCSYRWVDG